METNNARLILALQEQINGLWRYLEHSGNASEARQKADEWRRHTEDLRREIEAYLIKTHQQSSQYITAAAVIGFAGYFTTWSFTRDILSKNDSALVGLLGLCSFGIYALWEIFALQVRMRTVAKFGAILRDMLDPEHYEEQRVQIVRQEARAVQLMTPVWRIVVTMTITLMLFGGGLMCVRLGQSLF